MNRKIRYGILAAVLGAALRLPGPGADVSGLQPVETVLIREKSGMICLATDTGDSGTGTSLSTARENLQQRAQRKIYLETAEYLLVESETLDPMELLKEFRPGCMICRSREIRDAEAAGAYLKVHPAGVQLLEACAGKRTPVICKKKGGIGFCESESNGGMDPGGIYGSDSP